MFTDSHCHLYFPQFDGDRPQVLARAREAGVGRMLVVGTSRQTNAAALTLAEQETDLYCTLGIHPHDVAAATQDDLAWIEQTASHPKVKAIGECGLDYHYPNFDRERQLDFFRKQIQLSQKLNLPLVIHNRQSTEDLLSILETERQPQAYRGHWHCFDADWSAAERALALGLHLGFTGILTFKKSEDLRQIAAKIPADRILIETDCPYLPPVPFRGQRNEPAHIVWTAQKLAEVRGLSVEALGELSSNNAAALYRF